MGTDIHVATEAKTNGKWVCLDRFKIEDDGWCHQCFTAVDIGRDYDVFAILAGVRNGSGFAGCDTGDAVIPISEPKGIPEDVSPEIQAWSDRWGADGHSHSWLTTSEIIAHDFTLPKIHRGWVNAVEFLRFEAFGKPQSYSGGVSGGSIEHVSNDAMRTLIAEAIGTDGVWFDKQKALKNIKTAHPVHHAYTQVEWSEKQSESIPSFMVHVLPELLKRGNFDDTRIVFFFDN